MIRPGEQGDQEAGAPPRRPGAPTARAPRRAAHRARHRHRRGAPPSDDGAGAGGGLLGRDRRGAVPSCRGNAGAGGRGVGRRLPGRIAPGPAGCQSRRCDAVVGWEVTRSELRVVVAGPAGACWGPAPPLWGWPGLAAQVDYPVGSSCRVVNLGRPSRSSRCPPPPLPALAERVGGLLDGEFAPVCLDSVVGQAGQAGWPERVARQWGPASPAERCVGGEAAVRRGVSGPLPAAPAGSSRGTGSCRPRRSS